jgi:hypothetical protein
MDEKSNGSGSGSGTHQRVFEGIYRDVNLQEGLNGMGKNSRIVADRLSKPEGGATEDVQQLCQPGSVRCVNCGFLIDEKMKLPVYDTTDPISPMKKDISGAVVPGRDYVRIPLAWDEPHFEYSTYVACTPPCALRFMYDCPDFARSHVPHIFGIMMHQRHRITEPTNAAPPVECLFYMHTSKTGKLQVPKPFKTSTQDVGLHVQSFYWLLSQVQLIGYKEKGPKNIPPYPEEYNAITNHDHRFTQYYYQDPTTNPTTNPSDGLKFPPHLPPCGVRLDANPDADHETDFARDTVHPTLINQTNGKNPDATLAPATMITS